MTRPSTAIDGLRRIDLRPERRDLAVDRDAAVGDERLAGPARRDARRRPAPSGAARRASVAARRTRSARYVTAPGSATSSVACVVDAELGIDGRFPALLREAAGDVDVERRQRLERGQPEPLEEVEAGPVQERPARRARPGRARR